MIIKSGVYLITDGKGRIYVGSSRDIKQRWHAHRYKLRNGIHKNPKLQNVWNKYGEDYFQFSVAESCEPDSLQDKEQSWIDSSNPYYNLVKTAYSVAGRKHTEEMKDHIRSYRHTDEAKRKMSAARKGKPKSPETRARMSAAAKGRVFTEEHKANISLAKRKG